MSVYDYSIRVLHNLYTVNENHICFALVRILMILLSSANKGAREEFEKTLDIVALFLNSLSIF